ncbi:MAG: ABC transporter permease subunit [Thermoanaerobaculia bacterium]
MPVYDRRYRGYAGERITDRTDWRSRLRCWTVARFALEDLYRSRLTLILSLFACVPFLVFAVMIYGANNVDMLINAGFRVSRAEFDPEWAAIGKAVFFWYLSVQSFWAFILASYIGPTLVAPDLAHNALPLYLSRPIRRVDYVVGKLLVLLLPLSVVTWVTGLLLVALQTSLAGFGWLADHWRVVPALFVSSWIWILLLSLFAIAISAWVKWRLVATGMIFGIFLVSEAFGQAIAHIAGLRWGKLLSYNELVKTIWAWLFGGIDFMGGPYPADPLPLVACWTMLALVCAASLWVLHRKLRACEVSR